MKTRTTKYGWVLLAALGLLTAGCSARTTFTLKDDTELEGYLADHDAAQRQVLMRFGRGDSRWIPLDTVAKVEHPGGLLMALGGASLAFGFLMLLLKPDSDEGALVPSSHGIYAAGAFVVAPMLFVPGFINWSDADYQLERAGWTQ